MVTGQLPGSRHHIFIHPRVLSAGRKVEGREEEPEGSFLVCLSIQGRKFFSEVPSGIPLPSFCLKLGHLVTSRGRRLPWLI